MAGTPQATIWETEGEDAIAFTGPDVWFEIDADGIIGDAADEGSENIYAVVHDGIVGFQHYTTPNSGAGSSLQQEDEIAGVDTLDASDTPFGYGGIWWQDNSGIAEPHDTPVGEDLYIENRGGYDGFNDVDPATHFSGFLWSLGKKILRIWRRGTTGMAVVTNLHIEATGLREDWIEVFILPDGTAHTVADGQATNPWVVPAKWNGANIVEARIDIPDGGEGVGGTAEWQVRRVRSGTPVDVLSTQVSIAAAANSGSSTGVNASNDDLATGDQIYFDCNQVHSTTPAQGAVGLIKVRMP